MGKIPHTFMWQAFFLRKVEMLRPDFPPRKFRIQKNPVVFGQGFSFVMLPLTSTTLSTGLGLPRLRSAQASRPENFGHKKTLSFLDKVSSLLCSPSWAPFDYAQGRLLAHKLFPIKKPCHFRQGFSLFCSPSWARTKDPLINSQML